MAGGLIKEVQDPIHRVPIKLLGIKIGGKEGPVAVQGLQRCERAGAAARRAPGA